MRKYGRHATFEHQILVSGKQVPSYTLCINRNLYYAQRAIHRFNIVFMLFNFYDAPWSHQVPIFYPLVPKLTQQCWALFLPIEFHFNVNKASKWVAFLYFLRMVVFSVFSLRFLQRASMIDSTVFKKERKYHEVYPKAWSPIIWIGLWMTMFASMTHAATM